MRKNFAPYLSYKRDNNELLLFALRALSRDTAAYMRNRYGTEQEVIEIAEGDLLDKVRLKDCTNNRIFCNSVSTTDLSQYDIRLSRYTITTVLLCIYRSATSRSRTCSPSSRAKCLWPTTSPTTQSGSSSRRGSNIKPDSYVFYFCIV